MSGFWMGIHEVTNDQFMAFVESIDYVTHAEKQGSASVMVEGVSGGWTDVGGASWRDYAHKYNHPVQLISWMDAAEFCRWAGLELPTEAQWEYTCRSGIQATWGTKAGTFNWGRTETYWSSGEKPRVTTLPVASHPPNRWGLYDLSGNAMEWCVDEYTDSFYTTPEASLFNPVNGPRFVTLIRDMNAVAGTHRVVRGGGWGNNEGDHLRCAARGGSGASNASMVYAFRCILPRP
jgi:sulfatase modifying factor 1